MHGLPTWLRYLLVTAMVAVTGLLRGLADTPGNDAHPFITFVPVVLLAALLFDHRAALWATLLAAVTAVYCFLEPPGSFLPRTGDDWIGLAIFIGTGVGAGLLVEAMRRTIARLDRAERQHAILVEEVNHRVKNNMQMITTMLTLQGRALEGPAREALLTAARRAATMGKIHARFWQGSAETTRIDARDFLASLVEDLRRAYAGGRPIEVAVQAAPVSLSVEQALPLGLLINELVTNAFKYAFPGDRPGRVEIALAPAEAELRLTIADDGVGLAPAARRGIGTRLITVLTQQLRGTHLVVGETGTRHEIRFPA